MRKSPVWHVGPGPWAWAGWHEGSGADASVLLPLLPVAMALPCTPAGRGSCMTTVRGSLTCLPWRGFPHANVAESLAQPGCGWGVCGSGEVTVSSRQHAFRMFPSTMTSSPPARRSSLNRWSRWPWRTQKEFPSLPKWKFIDCTAIALASS